MSKTLHSIGMKFHTDKAYAHHYCDFYQTVLVRFEPKMILEIGVFNGASLRMWKEFYPDAEIFGIDINRPIKVPGCNILQLDATDVFGLAHQFRGIQFDLIIDDGSHYTKDQQIALSYLFEHHLANPGFYIMEDVHTSFIPAFVNSTLTTYDVIKKNFPDHVEYWDKDTLTDSGTVIIKKPQLI